MSKYNYTNDINEILQMLYKAKRETVSRLARIDNAIDALEESIDNVEKCELKFKDDSPLNKLINNETD